MARLLIAEHDGVGFGIMNHQLPVLIDGCSMLSNIVSSCASSHKLLTPQICQVSPPGITRLAR